MFGWFVPCNQHIKYILTQLLNLTLACISCCNVLVHSLHTINYTQDVHALQCDVLSNELLQVHLLTLGKKEKVIKAGNSSGCLIYTTLY